jgi:hypothetical protein
LVEDIQYEFPVGTDSILVWIDWTNDLPEYPGGHVIEWDETDNRWFRIVEWLPGQITFSGYLRYLDPTPPDTNAVPMRGMKIQMVDADQVEDDTLVSTIADYTGYFLLGPVDNNDGFLQGRRDIYLKVFAVNIAADVKQSHNDPTYSFETSTIEEIHSGDYTTSIVANLSQSEYFGVGDIVLDAYNEWITVGPYDSFAVQLVLRNDSATGFHPTQRAIYINRSQTDSLFYPDTWDNDIIFHEFGHLIEWDLGFFDASLGGTHSLTDFESIDFATSEAFAHWISSELRSDSYQINTRMNFADSAWFNLENGEHGLNATLFGSVNSRGENYEGAVAGIFWDISDVESDDYNNDGIQDTLSLGNDAIHQTIQRIMPSSHKPDNIDEFWDAWYLPPSFNHLRAMMDIWYEHGECCVGIRGDVNWDGTDADVLDMTFMVDRIFRGGAVPPCSEEADVNGNGISAEVADLTYIIDRIFRGGPLPPICSHYN